MSVGAWDLGKKRKENGENHDIVVSIVASSVLYPDGKRSVASKGEAILAHRELGPAELSKNISTSSSSELQ